MRLLLDEMYDPEIAEQLRRRGHDVAAISRSAHAGISDQQALALASDQGRALLTNNVRDFMVIHGDVLRAGGRHFGLVFTDDRSMPRAKATVGRYVTALDELLAARRADDALCNEVAWIPSRITAS